MLVTCPECGAEISEEADPCPRCGLPRAGNRSREYCEKVLECAYTQPQNGLRVGGACPSCRAFTEGEPQLAIKKEESRAGYYISSTLRCHNCGEEQVWRGIELYKEELDI